LTTRQATTSLVDRLVPVPQVLCVGHVSLDAISLIDRPLGEDERVVSRAGVIASGGPAATAAVALARLGVDVGFIGTVGDDWAGTFARRELEHEGVDVAGLRTVPGSTALSTIRVDANSGHRSIAAFDGVSGAPEMRTSDIAAARAASWIHVDHIGAAAIPVLRGAGVTTPLSVDAGNPIPGLDLRSIDLYAPTEQRLLERYPGRTMEDAVLAAVGDLRGRGMVAVTRGSAGSLAAVRAEDGRIEVLEESGFEVPVVSTLGAGDVFHGALVAGLIRGLEVGSALCLANACAALSCRALDGRSAIPSWDEALRFAADAGRPIIVDRERAVATGSRGVA
jgi:sulfofructose kinase